MLNLCTYFFFNFLDLGKFFIIASALLLLLLISFLPAVNAIKANLSDDLVVFNVQIINAIILLKA